MRNRFLRTVPNGSDPQLDLPFERDLLGYLEAGPTSAPDGVVLGARAAVERTGQRRWLRWVRIETRDAIALATVAAIVLAALFVRTSATPKPEEKVGATPRPITTPSPIPLPTGRPAQVVRGVELPPDTRDLVVGDGALWTVGWDGAVRRLNATSGASELTISLPVGGTGSAQYGAGALWVIHNGGISRIEPASGRHDDLPDPMPNMIASVDDSAVWLSGLQHEVWRLDVATLKKARVPLVPPLRCLDSLGGSVWGVTRLGEVVRIDAASLQFASSNPIPTLRLPVEEEHVEEVPGGVFVVALPDAVWVAQQGTRTTTRVNPATLAVEAGVELPSGMTIDGLVDLAGEAWVRSGSLLLHLDPRTNRVTDVIELDAEVQTVTPDGAALWVVANGQAELIQP